MLSSAISPEQYTRNFIQSISVPTNLDADETARFELSSLPMYDMLSGLSNSSLQYLGLGQPTASKSTDDSPSISDPRKTTGIEPFPLFTQHSYPTKADTTKFGLQDSSVQIGPDDSTNPSGRNDSGSQFEHTPDWDSSKSSLNDSIPSLARSTDQTTDSICGHPTQLPPTTESGGFPRQAFGLAHSFVPLSSARYPRATVEDVPEDDEEDPDEDEEPEIPDYHTFLPREVASVSAPSGFLHSPEANAIIDNFLQTKKKYKPVHLKTKPILGTVPAKYRIVRNITGDPLADMPKIDYAHIPDFVPTGRYT